MKTMNASPIVRYGGGFILACVAFIVLAPVFLDKPRAEGTQSAPALPVAAPVRPSVPISQRVRAEDLVMVSDGAFACLTRDSLAKITTHALRGEKTKVSAMMLTKGNDNGSCLSLNPSQRFKVLSVFYLDAETELGVMEIVGDSNKSANGMWTFTVGSRVVFRAP